MAVYLGNGLAFQGNWTGGVARIASAEQGATRGYTVISRYEKDCTTCESCGFGSNPTSDEEWQAQVDAFDTNVCELYKDNIDVAAAEGKITMDEYLMCIANGY